MNVQVKSSSGITLIPIETRFMAERKIFIEGDTSGDKAMDFMKKVIYLNRESSAPINVFINSNGGEINAGMLYYDAIQSSKAPISMWCVGHAYSMAAVIFASAKQRYMLPHSELMLHEPLLGSQIHGNASSIKSISDSLLETKQKMNRLLAKHTGHTEDEVEQTSRYDHYFTPEEALAFGLCDQIADLSMIMEG